jgi:hypothetical protein
MRRAIAVAVPETVLWNVLFEVNRKDIDSKCSRPFYFRYNLTIQKKYTDVSR